MHPFSDSDSSDSENGIRFKTHTTRKKNDTSTSRSHDPRDYKRRSRSPKRDRRYNPDTERRNKQRSRSRDRQKSSSRDRDRQKHKKLGRHHRKEKRKHSSRTSPKRCESTETIKTSYGPSLPPQLVPIEKQNTTTSEPGCSTAKATVCGDKVVDFLEKNISNGVTEKQISNVVPDRKIVDDVSEKNDVMVLKNNDVPEKNFIDDVWKKHDANKPPIKKDVNNFKNVGSENPADNAVSDVLIELSETDKSKAKKLKTDESQTDKSKFDESKINKVKIQESKTAESEIDPFGPALPPKSRELPVLTSERAVGPTIPDFLREKLKNDIGIEDSDEETYGPLPIEITPKSEAHLALEERALQMKLDQLNPTAEMKTTREEWMVELPTVQAAQIGLGPRQFRAKAGPDLSDRSSWTDTPQTKTEKTKPPIDLKKQTELVESHKYDQEQEAMIKNHKKKKKDQKSLLEQHQDKLKRKKEDEEKEGSNVRRPFSRDIDLKVNHFDEAQKKAIFKKAQLLDDRFSKGQSKYL